jgi:MurNAc alpha-1-phosphate uridylyltransferase
MILAAGRGERLRPLTESLPKPLVEVGGQALLARHLERLAAAGFRRAVINVSHLAERITGRFGSSAHGIAIEWSREETPLETAGGIARALPLLGAEPFLLVNSDVWCDFDFARWRRHELGERLAHLLLVPNPPFHPQGDFTLQDGRVGNGGFGNPRAPRYTYAGISVLSPRLVAGVRAGEKAQLAPLWRAAAERGEVSGELHHGLWSDVGTRERLAELEARLSQRMSER